MTEPYILLVEDNPDDQELTRRALRKHRIGNELRIACDGVEALAMLEADQETLPQVVLLDLKLPKLDGLEVLKALRANPRTRHVPVVVLTSSDEESDLVKSYEGGANSYIRKPVDFEQFSDAVRILGLYWMVMNRVPPQ